MKDRIYKCGMCRKKLRDRIDPMKKVVIASNPREHHEILAFCATDNCWGEIRKKFWTPLREFAEVDPITVPHYCEAAAPQAKRKCENCDS